jgi:hypothetical protein
MAVKNSGTTGEGPRHETAIENMNLLQEIHITTFNLFLKTCSNMVQKSVKSYSKGILK